MARDTGREMPTTDQELGAGTYRDMEAEDAVQRIWSSAPMTIARRIVITGSGIAFDGVRWIGRSVAIAPHAITAGALRTAEVALDDWRRRENERIDPSTEPERIEITVEEVHPSPSKQKRASSKATSSAKPSMTSTPTVNPPTSTPTVNPPTSTPS